MAKLPVNDLEMRAKLIAEYDVALVSGTIRVHTVPTWPCYDKRDMNVNIEITLTTSNGTVYRLTEIIDE